MESTKRFSDRVENYLKYRPRYPAAAIDHVMQTGALTVASAIADIGSGTGFSAQPFLDRNCTVYGVEPNEPMRRAAEELLGGFDRFKSVDGTAEATTLPDKSVDAIVCAQAFHWFNRPAARIEFMRIGRPEALVALIWNARLTNTPFLQGYEGLLLEHGSDYDRVNHENIGDSEIAEVLGSNVECAQFCNEQRFDWEGLRGRLLSSSYVPAEGQPGHIELFRAFNDLFVEHQQNGQVIMNYDTRVYTARLA